MAGKYAATLLAFLEGWRRVDLEAVLGVLTEDAVFEPDLKGSRHAGKPAIRAFWVEYICLMMCYY